jgi:hypothetical protein
MHHNDKRMARNFVRVWMRAVLQDKGWTANEWAVAADTSPTNITRMINGDGSVPTVETIVKLARIARSQPNLIGASEVEAPPETQHPNFCPACGEDLRPATRLPPRKSAARLRVP